MRTIRASEIGTYIYCKRAWWYQTNGLTPDNKAFFDSGLTLHARHRRMVPIVGCMRVLAYALLFFALVITITYFTLQRI